MVQPCFSLIGRPIPPRLLVVGFMLRFGQAADAGRELKKLIGDESVNFMVSPYTRTRMTYEIVRKELGCTDFAMKEDPRLRGELKNHEWCLALVLVVLMLVACVVLVMLVRVLVLMLVLAQLLMAFFCHAVPSIYYAHEGARLSFLSRAMQG